MNCTKNNLSAYRLSSILYLQQTSREFNAGFYKNVSFLMSCRTKRQTLLQQLLICNIIICAVHAYLVPVLLERHIHTGLESEEGDFCFFSWTTSETATTEGDLLLKAAEIDLPKGLNLSLWVDPRKAEASLGETIEGVSPLNPRRGCCTA